MNREYVQVSIDLKGRSTINDLLDCIAGFPLFVDELRREGPNGKAATAAVSDVITLIQKADSERTSLSLLGAFVPDILYIRIAELTGFDRWTRACAAMAPQLLLDQLRVRGVSRFYILDNAIREDRFDALVKIFSDVGYTVVSPSLDNSTESDVIDQINGAQLLWKHILYVERDASVNYLDAVRHMRKLARYTVAFRNQAPTVNSVEILQLAATGPTA